MNYGGDRVGGRAWMWVEGAGGETAPGAAPLRHTLAAGGVGHSSAFLPLGTGQSCPSTGRENKVSR